MFCPMCHVLFRSPLRNLPLTLDSYLASSKGLRQGLRKEFSFSREAFVNPYQQNHNNLYNADSQSFTHSASNLQRLTYPYWTSTVRTSAFRRVYGRFVCLPLPYQGAKRTGLSINYLLGHVNPDGSLRKGYVGTISHSEGYVHLTKGLRAPVVIPHVNEHPS